MGKIVFWLVVVFAVLLVLRLVNTAQSRARRGPASATPRKQDEMVRCVDCGVYLPSADAKAGPKGPLCGDPQCIRSHARRED